MSPVAVHFTPTFDNVLRYIGLTSIHSALSACICLKVFQIVLFLYEKVDSSCYECGESSSAGSALKRGYMPSGNTPHKPSRKKYLTTTSPSLKRTPKRLFSSKNTSPAQSVSKTVILCRNYIMIILYI